MTAYQQLTDQILDLLAQGVVPWQQPFSSRKAPVSACNGAGSVGLSGQ
jgi:antirestriction protein ArdC